MDAATSDPPAEAASSMADCSPSRSVHWWMKPRDSRMSSTPEDPEAAPVDANRRRSRDPARDQPSVGARFIPVMA